jgi:anti-anti-sigma factor
MGLPGAGYLGRMVEYDTVERSGEDVLLRLRGELAGELWTGRLREALKDHYVDDGVRRIRVDVSELTFLDNFGVATLVALRRESMERGKSFVVEEPTGQVLEKLRLTGVLRILQGGD